jgi:2-dehydropantoate 2-reductase
MNARAARFVVMGAGGVGGYFGARLAAAGSDVTFIARGAHLEAMRKNGLRLDSELGPLHLERVAALESAAAIDGADAVLFAVKLHDTENAARMVRDLAAGGAAIFTFQNGVESAERIARIVGPQNVVSGVARIGSHIAAPGVIAQTGRFASLEIAEPDGTQSKRTRAFWAACRAAGIDCQLSADIQRAIWMKFAMLAPLAGMTALTRGPLGPIRATPGSRALLEAAVRETIAVGAARTRALGEKDVAEVMALVDSLPAGIMASMAHDLLAGKPIELEGLSGAVVRLGAAHGVAVPTHTFIVQALAPFLRGKPVLAGTRTLPQRPSRGTN